MTYNLSAQAEAFLVPDELRRVAALGNNPNLVPAEPGIYGWWFDEIFEGLGHNTIRADGLRLLYAGIAPRSLKQTGKKRRTLRDRLKNHCRGTIARSTLRRTLAALLIQDEKFVISLTQAGKPGMSKDDEGRLSLWMDRHARVSFLIAPTPRVIEEELLRCGQFRLPLNIEGSRDDYRFELKRLRANIFSKR